MTSRLIAHVLGISRFMSHWTTNNNHGTNLKCGTSGMLNANAKLWGSFKCENIYAKTRTRQMDHWPTTWPEPKSKKLSSEKHAHINHSSPQFACVCGLPEMSVWKMCINTWEKRQRLKSSFVWVSIYLGLAYDVWQFAKLKIQWTMPRSAQRVAHNCHREREIVRETDRA